MIMEKSGIKIMLTSKSGCIACIDNIYGTLNIDGHFSPYTERELLRKTAYKEKYGWKEYSSIDEYIQERTIYNEKRAAIKLQDNLRKEEKAIKDEEELNNLIVKGVIPTNIHNLRLVMKKLLKSNWGGWTLPKMSIGYSANQYDCEGQIAVTIKLDTPISDEDYGIENERMFVIGNPNGFLRKYHRI